MGHVYSPKGTSGSPTTTSETPYGGIGSPLAIARSGTHTRLSRSRTPLHASFPMSCRHATPLFCFGRFAVLKCCSSSSSSCIRDHNSPWAATPTDDTSRLGACVTLPRQHGTKSKDDESYCSPHRHRDSAHTTQVYSEDTTRHARTHAHLKTPEDSQDY